MPISPLPDDAFGVGPAAEWEVPLLAGPTPEEIAFAAELARLYPSDDDDVIYADDLVAPGEAYDGLPPLPVDDAAAAVLAAAARAEGCGGTDLLLLESTDPVSLDDPLARIAYLQVLDRVEAAVAARRYDAVLAVVPVREDPADYAREHALTLDIAVARRTSLRAAGQLVDAARAGRTAFPGMQAALAAGRISDRHVRILLERTRAVADDDVRAEIGRRAVPLACSLVPPRFQDAVDHLVAELDPDALARRRRARADRDVWSTSLPEGMGMLGITGDAATIAAIARVIGHAAKDLRAQRGGAAAQRAGNADAAIGACRSDAAAALIPGTPMPDGSTLLDPARAVVHLQLVMDLETLRGERDNPALLDGTPVPAEMGRDLAAAATWFRRIIVDPLTRATLDFGTDHYLPPKLRRFVLARDRRCRIPGCGATRDLQMDHALPFPHGPSDPANTGALSPGCHHAKTAGHIQIEDSAADGSCTLVTLLGQRIHVPPRPYLGLPAHPDDDRNCDAEAPPAARTGPAGDRIDDAPPF